MELSIITSFFGIMCYFGYGSAKITDVVSSQCKTSPESKVLNGLVDVLDLLVEEKSLRRQLEQDVEHMKQEIIEMKQNSATGCQEEISTLQETVQQVQNENHILRQTIQSLQESTGNLEDNKVIVEQWMEMINRSVEYLKMNITVLQPPTRTYSDSVGFSAKRTVGGTVSAGQIVLFNTVVTNVGGGYNETDGIFYCSLSGLYLFQTTLVSSTAGGQIQIEQNGSRKRRIYAGHTSGFDSGSGTVFLRLQVGDQVWVKAANTLNVVPISSFNGALIAS